jgi:hypothetical protein
MFHDSPGLGGAIPALPIPVCAANDGRRRHRAARADVSPSWHTQADAAALFKEEVYPDIIGRHERSRARSEAGAVPTVNAIVAQKHGRAVRDAFGADGAQLRGMSVSCVSPPLLPCFHLQGSGLAAMYNVDMPMLPLSRSKFVVIM